MSVSDYCKDTCAWLHVVCYLSRNNNISELQDNFQIASNIKDLSII